MLQSRRRRRKCQGGWEKKKQGDIGDGQLGKNQEMFLPIEEKKLMPKEISVKLNGNKKRAKDVLPDSN